MNRRTFIKALTGLLAAGGFAPAVLATELPNAWDKFDPGNMYGQSYQIADYLDRELLREIWKLIAPDIRYWVPPAYRHKIEFRYENPKPNDYDPLCLRGYFAWVYKP